MSALRIAGRATAVCFAAIAILSSCSEESRSYVANISDPAKTPTMTTTAVSTFISDSGYTRYHITADRWDIYDDSIQPLWVFPSGLELENYDLKMQPAATLVCDSATYYTNKRLWRLDGNVVMVNVQKDTFLTQQLFWDQKQAEVYSDSFIHIVRSQHIIEGYGFVSDQNMSAYTVNRPTAIIPMKREGGRPFGPSMSPSDTIDATAGYTERPTAPEPASVRNTRSAEYLRENQAPPSGGNSGTTPGTKTTAASPSARTSRGSVTRRN